MTATPVEGFWGAEVVKGNIALDNRWAISRGMNGYAIVPIAAKKEAPTTS